MPEEAVLALDYWLREEFNMPSRSDWYLIQLTHIVAGMLSKDKIDINTWKLQFQTDADKAPKTDAKAKQDRLEYEKALAALAKFNVSRPGIPIAKGNIHEDRKNGRRTRNFENVRTPGGRRFGV